MATLKDLLTRYTKSAPSSAPVIIYGTALSDSSDGEVLVQLDEELTDYEDDDNAVEVFLDEDADTVDTIDEDGDADALGTYDSEGDVDEDETYYETIDGDAVGEADVTDFDGEPIT